MRRCRLCVTRLRNYDLPLNYLDAFPRRIEQVSVAQVRAALARHIDPAAMATVIVGAPEAGEAK